MNGSGDTFSLKERSSWSSPESKGKRILRNYSTLPILCSTSHKFQSRHGLTSPISEFTRSNIQGNFRIHFNINIIQLYNMLSISPLLCRIWTTTTMTTIHQILQGLSNSWNDIPGVGNVWMNSKYLYSPPESCELRLWGEFFLIHKLIQIT